MKIIGILVEEGGAVSFVGVAGNKSPLPQELRKQFEMQLPLSDFEFSVRTTNVLANAGVHTLGQLAAMTEAQILAVNCSGRKTVNEIKEVLAQRGLRLAE